MESKTPSHRLFYPIIIIIIIITITINHHYNQSRQGLPVIYITITMLFSTIATAFLATLAAAAPSQKARRDIEVTLTYWAAADNVFSEVIPANGLLVPVGSDLSFTYISSDAP